MKKIILVACLLCAALFPCRLVAQTLYQDAMAIYEFRHLLLAYDEAYNGGAHQQLVPSRNAKIGQLPVPLQSCIRAIAGGGSGNGVRQPFTTGFDGNIQTNQALQGDSLIRQQQAIAAFYDLEQYVRGADGNPATPDIGRDKTLTQAPQSLDFLPQINQQLRGGSGVGITEVNPTGGVLSALSGGIPEAAIIQGIVDWTVQRAKEELMRAFLQNWLTHLEAEPVLQAAFPKSLDLLATTDLTTIISQGAVWKAAFEQDLRDVPAHLPAIMDAVLAHVPAGRLDADTRLQLTGAARVASGIYVQLHQKHKLSTAILTTSNTLLADEKTTYSYAERGLFATQVLLNAVQIEEAGALKVLRPETIQNLTPGQFDELWNLLVIQERAALLAISQVSDAELDAVLAKIKTKTKAALLDIASAASILLEIRHENTADKKTSDEDRFQEAAAYFGLVTDLLEEGLDFVALFGVQDAKARAMLDQLIRPLGQNIAGIAEGISTKQYGLVVTNLIASLRLLSSELVLNQEAKDLLTATADAIQLIGQLREDLSSATNADELLQQVQASLQAFRDSIRTIDGGKLAAQIDALIKDLQTLAGKELKELKKELDKRLEDALKALEKHIKDIDLGDGLEEVAQQLNTYGRFMVNVLTAENSDDVKEAFEDAAMKTGSYMVKQTSKFSATVTFLPGFALGREYARMGGSSQVAPAFLQPATFTGMCLPIGMEFAVGTGSRGIGAVGLYAQVADLGAVMNFRLKQTTVNDTVGADTLAVTDISPEIGFRQVLSPGLGVVCHVAKAPIAFGARMSYAPLLRSLEVNGDPTLQASVWQVGGFVAVDVTVFQFFASRKKCKQDWKRISE